MDVQMFQRLCSVTRPPTVSQPDSRSFMVLSEVHIKKKICTNTRAAHRWFRTPASISVDQSSDHLQEDDDQGTVGPSAPWQLTQYHSKKIGRPMDSHGNIIDSLENTSEWFTFTNDVKLRLAAEQLAPTLGTLSPSQLIDNAVKLGSIVPGGLKVLSSLKPGDLIRLAARAPQVPLQLIALRDALPPRLSVTRVIEQWPDILLLPIEELKNGYQQVYTYFGNEIGEEGVCAMLETTPSLLHDKVLTACIRGAGHLMPLAQLASSLTRYDDYWMQFQSLESEPRNDYEDTLAVDNYYLQYGPRVGGRTIE